MVLYGTKEAAQNVVYMLFWDEYNGISHRSRTRNKRPYLLLNAPCSKSLA
jgi:hypothetical protein